MKSRFLLAATLTFLFCAGGARWSASQKADTVVYSDDPLVLSKIKSVRVYVDPITQGVQFPDLTEQDMQTDTELKLRLAGVAISNAPIDKLMHDNIPLLHVNLSVLKGVLAGQYVYSIRIELMEWELFSLTRNPRLKIRGIITWRKSSFGTVGVNNIREVRETVKDTIDVFCNDYLKANPKN